jgi:hypothetical protein
LKTLATLVGFLLVLFASLPACAQPADRDHPRRFQRFQPDRPPPPRELPRRGAYPPQGEPGAGERGPGVPPGATVPRRPGQLTPEERQQLRRDIREHGRDVYRERPRRF